VTDERVRDAAGRPPSTKKPSTKKQNTIDRYTCPNTHAHPQHRLPEHAHAHPEDHTCSSSRYSAEGRKPMQNQHHHRHQPAAIAFRRCLLLLMLLRRLLLCPCVQPWALLLVAARPDIHLTCFDYILVWESRGFGEQSVAGVQGQANQHPTNRQTITSQATSVKPTTPQTPKPRKPSTHTSRCRTSAPRALARTHCTGAA